MKKEFRLFFIKIGLSVLFVSGLLLLPTNVFAATSLETGVAQVDQEIALGATSPIVIVVRVIQVALGLLGIIAVSLIIYAGFIWMTSGGSEEKVAQAKKTLRNAIIGLLIVLSAWGITYFILQKLLGATGMGDGGGTAGGINAGSFSLSTLGSCSIDTVYPEPGSADIPRNTAILVTAKEAFQLDTVCYDANKKPCACNNTAACNRLNFQNIQIFRTDDGNGCVSKDCAGNVTEAEVSVPAGGKTLVIRPLGALGSASGNVEYAVRLTNDLKKQGNSDPLFKSCSADFLEWTFETNTKLDLEPPQVKRGGYFPPVDTAADTFQVNSAAKTANAKIQVNSCPGVYRPAAIQSITPRGGSVAAEATADPGYSGVITDFTVQVKEGQMQLFSGNSSLGSSQVLDGKAVFAGYFIITPQSVVDGNSWNVKILPVRTADSLTVGHQSYIFVSKKSGAGNEILIPSSCSLSEVAGQIILSISGNDSVNVSGSGNEINLFAKETGLKGNALMLASNSRALSLSPFSGGTDKSDSYTIKGAKDQPINTVVRVDFNEAMNPMVLSGKADEVAPYIRLVNANLQARPAGDSCGAPKDCLSYNCEASVCTGNYISGTFSLSNIYTTLEFVSDKECGVNSCGEKIYCLPAASNLALRINAANLQACQNNSDCQALAPYSTCVSGVCRDTAGQRNYPAANPFKLDGAVDLAFNSLDGNRDTKADGRPAGVYNYFVEGTSDFNKRDGFEFSFFIGNEINLTPPKISLTSPRLAETDVLATRPVIIDFNELMMARTLTTGSLLIDNGLSSNEHKLINLRSSVDKPLGYWLASEDLEIGNPDGRPDYTSLQIKHSDFFESVTYITQIGSGVKNIYQNCFKPSVGPSCLSLTEANPSCCFGSGTNTLDAAGNCIR